MALDVAYMMEYQHPGLLVTDLHWRSSTDRQSTWPRVIFGDIFTLNADGIAWKLLKMALEVEYMMEYQACQLQIFIEGHPLAAKVPDWGSFLALYFFFQEMF